MKKLFITSSFCDVSHHFETFCGERIEGRTVTFIPTASLVEDFTAYVDNDKRAFKKLGVAVEELFLSDKSEGEIAAILAKNDFIFVSGGNTFYLLQELKRTKADQLILEQIKQGKIYIGTSAGSVVLAKNIEYLEKVDDKTKAQTLKEYSGLGCVDFYPLPHYKSEPFTAVIDEVFSDKKEQLPLIPISNTQVIEVKGSDIQIKGVL